MEMFWRILKIANLEQTSSRSWEALSSLIKTKHNTKLKATTATVTTTITTTTTTTTK